MPQFDQLYSRALSQREMARALGGDPLGRDGILAPGPRHSPHDRSLRVWLDLSAPNGFRVHSFAGDDPLACRDHILAMLGLPQWRPDASSPTRPTLRPPRDPGKLDDRGRQLDKALWLWDQSRTTGVTLIEYMKFRGIHIPHLPATLRYLRPRPPKHPHPTMIAPFALATEPEPGQLAVPRQAITGVHLTRLHADGCGKAEIRPNKIMLGRSLGTPIVLAPINDNMGLAITEGIEDALSVHVATGLGAWAAGSADHMPALAYAVPDYVDLVTIVADGNETGQRNAHRLAERLLRRGIAVEVQTPGAELRAER